MSSLSTGKAAAVMAKTATTWNEVSFMINEMSD